MELCMSPTMCTDESIASSIEVAQILQLRLLHAPLNLRRRAKWLQPSPNLRRESQRMQDRQPARPLPQEQPQPWLRWETACTMVKPEPYAPPATVTMQR